MKKEEKQDKGQQCPYCGVIKGIKISEEKGDFHLCPVTGFMTPFIPIGSKDKKFKNVKRERGVEDSPMTSWGFSDSDDPMMGAPTRGRR